MEDGKTGPYRPFLPLDSSSPLKDEEEVAYRQDQAAGLVASSRRLDMTEESMLGVSLHSSCKLDTSSQFGSPVQSSNSPPSPPEGSRLRPITGRRNLDQEQSLPFMHFGPDVFQAPDRNIEQVPLTNSGRPLAWSQALPQDWTNVNHMSLQSDPMMQNTAQNVNYFSQMPPFNPSQLPPPPNATGFTGIRVTIPNEHYWGYKPGRECKFCKNNGEPIKQYRSHVLRNPTTGALICPVLRGHVCEVCGATGDRAHTRNYCPDLKNDGRLRCSIPVSLKKTKRQSDGQLRG